MTQLARKTVLDVDSGYFSKLLLIANLLLAIIIGIAASKLVNLWVDSTVILPTAIDQNGWVTPHHDGANAIAPTQQAERLFGPATPGSNLSIPDNLTETTLDLELNGVIRHSNSSASIAWISAGDSPAKGYRINDTLPGGAIIQEITAARVILARGGRMEQLKLPREELLVTESEGPGEDSIPSMSIDSAEFRSSLPRLLSALQLEPVETESGDIGVRIGGDPASTAFAQTGLNQGDVIIGLNSQSFSDISSIERYLREVTPGDTLELQIKRDDTVMSVRVLLETS